MLEQDDRPSIYYFYDNILLDLKIIYDIFIRVPDTSNSYLKDCLKAYIIDTGKSLSEPNNTIKKKTINENTALCIHWIDNILALKRRIYDIVLNCFKNVQLFDVVINSAFQIFINAFDPASEYLTVYLDHSIKNYQEVRLSRIFLFL